MFLLKSVLCSLFALSSVSSVNAWGLSEPEVNRVVRGEAEKQARTALVQHYQATGHVKSNFRLESSYSALKEARKSMLWFILAYPALAAVFYQFDTQKRDDLFQLHAAFGCRIVCYLGNGKYSSRASRIE